MYTKSERSTLEKLTRQNTGSLGSLPIELITDGISNYLSSAHMGALQQTCRFFKENELFNARMSQKSEEWNIVATNGRSYFISSKGHVYTLPGLENSPFVPIPIYLANNKPIVRIVPGKSHVFYMDIEEKWHVGGEGNNGELCLDYLGEVRGRRPVPIALPNGKPIIDIVAGKEVSFLCDIDGNWHGCGKNSHGQLGIEDHFRGLFIFLKPKVLEPTLLSLPNEQPIIKVVTNGSTTFFQDKQGLWFGCGYNGIGHLGFDCEDSNIFKPVSINLPNEKAIASITVGNSCSIIIDEDRSAYGFGQSLNIECKLGVEVNKKHLISKFGPIHLSNNKPIIEIILASKDSTYIRDTAGDWHACGNNHYGQMGTGVSGNSYHKPIKLCLPCKEPIIRIVTSGNNTFFLTAANQWYGCGMICGIPGHEKNLENLVDEHYRVSTPIPIDLNIFEEALKPNPPQNAFYING